jgi:hypothetical protein
MILVTVNRTVATALLALTGVAAVGATVLFFKGCSPRAPVTVTLRLAVSPKEQAGFVAAQANSVRFKYEIGKKAGLRPVQAQKLAVKTMAGTALVEARIGLQTPEECRRYTDSFVEVLQAQCGSEVRFTVVDRSVR